MHRLSAPVRHCGWVILSVMLTGCSGFSYYLQSAQGQIDVWQKTRPIDRVLQHPDSDETLKKRLRLVQQARRFAVSELGLPDNNSYTGYADLQRPYVVWSVFATPAFSLQPVTWCFPLFGCLAYRGYFDRADAEQLASELEQQGHDVAVAGIPAYSTLGWFDDPVLNSMMRWQDHNLVGTLFHELTHQKIYLPGDTVFNESLARTVEMEGLRRWMELRQDSEAYRAYLLDQQREQQFIELILALRQRLEHVYQQSQPGLADKLEQLRWFRRQYLQLKQQWGGYDGYDAWVFSGVNNAKVMAVATYHDYVPAFQSLLAEQQGNLTAFYAEVQRIAELPQPQRDVLMRARLSRE